MNTYPSSISKKGFTLIELMMVMTMIVTLLSVGFIPYSYYMDRAYVERTSDRVSQEWILAHTAVKNGILSDPSHHATLVMKLEKGSHTLDMFLTSGGGLESMNPYKSVPLESKIEILGFSGLSQDDTLFYYKIFPPYATGAFFSRNNTLINSTGALLALGYSGALSTSGRMRNLLLKPYY